ncbi:MAG: TatD family deoxyribonuclease [Lachnoclostridium sp.]|nr:TatD family deoxyribonuclease [Lachnoclostridium sp.]
MAGIIDSHAHVCGNYLFPRFEEVIADAKAAGVEKIMIICTETEEAKRAIEIAKENPMFDVGVAFYPNDVAKVSDDDWKELEKLVRMPEVKLIGEIGMDYFEYEVCVPKEMQKEAFIRQIQWANELNKPIAVHMRLATDDTRAIMKEYLKVPGIMHCYSGGYSAMQDFLDMGMYISFSGNITFELDDVETQKAVKYVPLDRILVETDAPSLTPAPVQHLPNEPKYIVHVIDHICKVRGMERQELIDAVNANYHRLMNR